MTRVQILATVAGILFPISGQNLAAHQSRHPSRTHLRGAVEENRGAVTSPYGLPRVPALHFGPSVWSGVNFPYPDRPYGDPDHW